MQMDSPILLYLVTLVALFTLGVRGRPCPDARNGSFLHSNFIFNAIHSSMRQWGSSIHHNGMTFFLASVGKGTLLHHGTSQSEPISGTEFLAFEPEHARNFARFMPRPHPPPIMMDQQIEVDERTQKKLANNASLVHREAKWREAQNPPHDKKHGWLHTYRAAKDLRLLYVDGMSTGKTPNGTLDSQDRLLLNGGPHSNDYERAVTACDIARNDFQDQIDGVI